MFQEHRHCVRYLMQTKSPVVLSSAHQSQHLVNPWRFCQFNPRSRCGCARRAQALAEQQRPAHAGSATRHGGTRRQRAAQQRGSGGNSTTSHRPSRSRGSAPPRKGDTSPSGAALAVEKQKSRRVSGGAALTEQQSGVHAVEEHPADHRPAQIAQGPAHEDVVDVADVLADIGGQVGEGGTQHRDAHPLQGRVRGHLSRPGEGSALLPAAPGRPRSLIHSPAPGRRRRAPR